MAEKFRTLILGIGGMLGNELYRVYSENYEHIEVYGALRNLDKLPEFFRKKLSNNVFSGADAGNPGKIEEILQWVKPDVVINCIGIIKQLPEAADPLTAISINALFPHILANLCGKYGARMIHISTDCVFDGKNGNYIETDFPSANDLYGRTKFLGEVHEPHCLTLRTSIIGHELNSAYGLADWFLSQQGKAKGYRNAVFSGFPTYEMARIIAEYAIPDAGLSGLYHVSSEPINKYELLKLIADAYGKDIEIEPYDSFRLDRSLNSERFRERAGYMPPDWLLMIKEMRESYTNLKK